MRKVKYCESTISEENNGEKSKCKEWVNLVLISHEEKKLSIFWYMNNEKLTRISKNTQIHVNLTLIITLSKFGD